MVDVVEVLVDVLVDVLDVLVVVVVGLHPSHGAEDPLQPIPQDSAVTPDPSIGVYVVSIHR